VELYLRNESTNTADRKKGETQQHNREGAIENWGGNSFRRKGEGTSDLFTSMRGGDGKEGRTATKGKRRGGQVPTGKVGTFGLQTDG